VACWTMRLQRFIRFAGMAKIAARPIGANLLFMARAVSPETASVTAIGMRRRYVAPILRTKEQILRYLDS
jgi:hypothetical protein